jgi:hypothetical protein
MTAMLPRYAWAVSAERFLNSYHNASTPPGPDVPAELAAFMLAVDPVLAQAAELARVLARAHQGAATHLIGEDWSHARKYFSLSEKANLVRLATLTSAARDGLAQLHLPNYQDKVGT